MTAAQGLDLYLDTVIAAGLYTKRRRLRFHMETLFAGIDLVGKRVLDIGGGSGLHSCYSAARGAASVVCLEPEAAGSSAGITEHFLRLQRTLQRHNVELRPIILQELPFDEEPFDVILLHDSINHLNENACIHFLDDPAAQAAYGAIFARLHALSRPGARLIICDCSRHCFFTLIGRRNPFNPTIAWRKHQTPETWAKALGAAGFTNPRISWSSFNAFGVPGRILLGHKAMAYFLTSHFRLVMDRP